MKTFRLLAAAIIVGFLTGCTTGPDYHKPEPSAPGQWTSPLAGGEREGAPDIARWWTQFSDPALDSLVSRAVESNLDLRMATARIRETRAAEAVTGAALWPQANTSGSYERTKPFNMTGAKGNRETDVFQAGFDAGWELDFFGGVQRAKEAAAADREAADEDRRDVLVSLAAEVARNYFDLRSAQNRLAIVQNNIQIQKETLELVRARFQAGLTSEFDVKIAEAQLATMESSVPSLETGAKVAIHRLGVLLGKAPGTLVEELSPIAPLPAAPPEVPVGLPSDLLRRRPDIRRAERQIAAATARIGVATADLFPKFSLTGALGRQSDSFGGLRLGANQFWSIGPGVRWPVFDAGRIRANIEVQNARQEQALVAYENTVLRSFEDVENALVAYAKEQVRLASLEKAVDANRKALDIANDLYAQGLVSFLNVLDAERSLSTAEEQHTQSKATILTDLVALYKALGGGWQPAN